MDNLVHCDYCGGDKHSIVFVSAAWSFESRREFEAKMYGNMRQEKLACASMSSRCFPLLRRQ